MRAGDQLRSGAGGPPACVATRAAIALAAVVTWGTSGCFVVLDHELPLDGTGEHIATRDDFAGFLSWPSAVVAETAAAAPHEASVRTIYVNQAPPDEAEAFPVGTIVVKTGAGGEATGESGAEVHAMVKRGNGFNAEGARGWEWFELSALEGNDDAPLIVWRGANPPEGESYGCTGDDCGDAEALTCNTCHAGSVANDFVNSAALTLGDVDASLLGGRQ